MDTAALAQFEAGRGRLASLAYRLLGSAADAEDAVQDTFLRWQAADRERVAVPEAWLTKVLTNLCLDRLRSAQARHERAAGDWLPEPLLAGDPMLDPADTFEQRCGASVPPHTGPWHRRMPGGPSRGAAGVGDHVVAG